MCVFEKKIMIFANPAEYTEEECIPLFTIGVSKLFEMADTSASSYLLHDTFGWAKYGCKKINSNSTVYLHQIFQTMSKVSIEDSKICDISKLILRPYFENF